MISGIGERPFWADNKYSARQSKVSEVSETKEGFASYIKKENNFPYSSKAKDGIIEYNGVVFVGDSKSNSLSLGDMSNVKRVIHIQLSGGGMLNVNYDNIGDLKNAIGMFSGKDQGIILKAIAKYHLEEGLAKNAEDEEEEIVEDIMQARNNVEDGRLSAF